MLQNKVIRELKTRISKLNAQNLKISPTKIILNSANNMGSVQSEKYGLCSKEIEKILLSSERFRTIFNMHRIEKTKLLRDRLNRYDKKKYGTKRRKITPGKFCKQSAQNTAFFNKENVFSIRKKKKIYKIDYY